MIAVVQGTVLEQGSDHVVVDVGGLGYRVHVPLRSLPALGPAGNRVRLRTHLEVREDSWTLYGFETREEVEMYHALVSVNGVGPKMALAVLSVHEVPEIVSGILAEDVKMFTRISGIGKKTVGRLFLELRDKVGGLAAGVGLPAAPGTPETAAAPGNGAGEELRSALRGLGFQAAEADAAIAHAVAAAGEDAGPDELLRTALRYFRRQHG